jgi:DNA-binding IclR family transcriptional regulator
MSEPLTNPAVHKAIAITQYIADRSDPVSVKELSYSLSIPQASCYRIVRTLLRDNWLREDPMGGLRIAFGLAHVARSFSEVEAKLNGLNPALVRLAEDLQMSVKVMLREGDLATVAMRAEPARANSITSPIGSRIHLSVGSAAGVLLSFLQDAEIERIISTAPAEVWQRQGPEDVWARVRECRHSGICCDLGLYHSAVYAMSAPLKLSDSLIVAVTLVGWKEDFEEDQQQVLACHLLEAVRNLS